jgi:hypothetical protein
MSESSAFDSVCTFAKNVTDREELGLLLVDVARHELGVTASDDQVERQASKLLGQALFSVGIDPASEKQQRNRLFAVLRGDDLSVNEVQKAAEYILGQMVIQPKGALAECLAIIPSVRLLHALIANAKLPPNAVYLRGAWSRRLVGRNENGPPAFGEWREAADGLFCCRGPLAANAARAVGPSAPRTIGEDHLIILGIIEVKCYHAISRRNLLAQVDNHIARLAGGLQFRDSSGRNIDLEYAPEKLWYGLWQGGRIQALPVAEQPFSLEGNLGCDERGLTPSWTHPLMAAIVRVAIGPRQRGERGARRSPRARFDVLLPYDDEQLEEIAAAIADYTLGVMADQPDVDLPGWKWTANVIRALESAPDGALSKLQLARRAKIIRRLRPAAAS